MSTPPQGSSPTSSTSAPGASTGQATPNSGSPEGFSTVILNSTSNTESRIARRLNNFKLTTVGIADNQNKATIEATKGQLSNDIDINIDIDDINNHKSTTTCQNKFLIV